MAMPDAHAHVRKYLPIVERLAEKALDMAIDASPTKPREGEFVRSLMVAVPVANALLGREPKGDPGLAVEAIVQAAEASNPKIVDGRGHARLAYHYLLFDLVRRGELLREEECGDAVFRIDPPPHDDLIHHRCLYRMCMCRGEIAPLVEWVPYEEGLKPYHEQTVNDTPDTWVYREMVALHGQFNWIIHHNHVLDAPEDQAHAVARYHLAHTQPDYTTYQPWALAAFLYFPDTVGFAEQQLHDVETHLYTEGPPGALVPGLLLADAVATLRSVLRQNDEPSPA